jgi:hypothetical protein
VIAIHAKHLKIRRVAVVFKPFIKACSVPLGTLHQFPAMLITAALLVIYRKEHRFSDTATSAFIPVSVKCGFA